MDDDKYIRAVAIVSMGGLGFGILMMAFILHPDAAVVQRQKEQARFMLTCVEQEKNPLDYCDLEWDRLQFIARWHKELGE